MRYTLLDLYILRKKLFVINFYFALALRSFLNDNQKRLLKITFKYKTKKLMILYHYQDMLFSKKKITKFANYKHLLLN